MRALGSIVLLGAVFAAPGQHFITDFGRRVLSRTDQIIEAEVVSVLPRFRGITTARLKVLERFSGFDREPTAVVMYVDDLAAPDAFGSTLERSSIAYERRRRAGLGKALEDISKGKLPKPEEEVTGTKTVKRTKETGGTVKAGAASGVRLAKGEKALFFLRRKGASYSLLGLVPAADPLYAVKRSRLRDILRLEAIAALDLRATRARRFFTLGLESPNPWARGNSAREILALATRFPEIFTKEDATKLMKQLLVEREAPIRAALERAVRSIDPEAALEFATGAEERERKRLSKQLNIERQRLDRITLPQLRAYDVYRTARMYGRAATGLMAVYLDDKQAIVRERAAHALAEFGGPSCRPALREALSRERDLKAASALIYACGIKSDSKAVGVVAQRLQQPALERIAIHALARIGTAEARIALLRHKALRSGETVQLIDSLLREEFSRKK